ncbi:MAG: GntR family transcriptional regulator [Paracoccaceae bacterium]|nr:GntR family transcriptional regulator [Paracoccaceae bacterium]
MSSNSNLQSVSAYSKIREDILASKFPPNHKLKVKELSGLYDIGVIPIREALSRLESEELVTHVGQTGFTVSQISKEDLRSLVETRILIESLALELSIKNFSNKWEEELVLAFHRLQRTDRVVEINGLRTINRNWITYHHSFHLTLINNSGLPWLNKFCSELLDHSTKYGVFITVEYPNFPRKSAKEHKDLYDCVLAKDSEGSKTLLKQHYHTSIEHILKFLT